MFFLLVSRLLSFTEIYAIHKGDRVVRGDRKGIQATGKSSIIAVYRELHFTFNSKQTNKFVHGDSKKCLQDNKIIAFSLVIRFELNIRT